MYQSPHFATEDSEYILDFINNHPFAIMVSRGERLIATHIPILIEENEDELRLYGHLANHNDQHKYLEAGAEVLLIFSGPHGYISSSWYKKADISTWNYAAVHINATLKIQSTEELEDSLKKLVHRFESNQEDPLLYEDLPSDIVESHLPRITGFWLNPVKIEAISKMSQNQPEENVSSILEHLNEEKGAEELCNHIKKEHEKKNS